MRMGWVAAAGCVMVMLAGVAGAQRMSNVSHVSDGDGAYKTGQYRNLFAERGHSAKESRAKIEAAFQQLFHGDKQTQAVYFEAGRNANGPLGYVTDWANNDARTEGMSYGMIIAVELNKRHEFDAIWNWAHTYMLITDPKNPSVGYFAWSMNTDGTPRSTGPAPDGEEYFAMSLYFAAHRWGNGKGIYDYQAEADRILRGMRHHPVLTGTPPFRIHPNDPPFVMPHHPWPSPNETAREKAAAAAAEAAKARGEAPPKPPVYPDFSKFRARAETIGPMADEEHAMILFVPNVQNRTTDPSYHLPAFYELWARWGPVEDRAFWERAAEVSRGFFAKVTGPETALTPDRANFDATPAKGWNGRPAEFGYDSWRSVSNWSVDYSWWRKSADEPVLSERYQRFLAGQGVGAFVDQYTLDGKPLSERHSPGMVATAAVGSLATAKSETANAFVDALWNTPVPSGEQRYYDGMLYLMSMMHCSGEFRIWAPR
ncbi:MAG TPA: glycosyl hydrolase family 8 [Acidobacteriaceae bacterium]